MLSLSNYIADFLYVVDRKLSSLDWKIDCLDQELFILCT